MARRFRLAKKMKGVEIAKASEKLPTKLGARSLVRATSMAHWHAA